MLDDATKEMFIELHKRGISYKSLARLENMNAATLKSTLDRYRVKKRSKEIVRDVELKLRKPFKKRKRNENGK